MSRASAFARSALVGAIVGGLLSALRAPLSSHWAAPAWSDDRDAFAMHMIAAAAAMFCAWRAVAALAEEFSMLAFVWGVAGGLALHGLVLAPFAHVSSVTAALVTAVVAYLVASWIATPGGEREPAGRAVRWTVGLLLLGAELGMALWALARPLRALGGGEGADDAALALVFVLLVALAASAAATFLSNRRAARVVVVLSLLVALVACLDSQRVLARLTGREGLERFLTAAPWTLSLDDLGLWNSDALLAARVFVLPAFAIGAALAAVRTHQQASTLCLGLLCGFARAFPEPASLPIAAASAALACWGARDAPLAARRVGLVVCAVAFAFGWNARFDEPPSFDRFAASGQEVLWRAQQGEHDLAIVAARGEDPSFVADGHAWIPARRERHLERALFERLAGAKSVLLVGPLTPTRAATLRALGVERVDRTAPFFELLGRIESVLSDGAAAELRGGSITLSPAAAAANARRGIYDAVIVPPVAGVAARVALPSLPNRVRFYAWLDGAGPIAAGAWSERVDVACDARELWIGAGDRGSFAAGRTLRADFPVARLLVRSAERRRRDLTRTATRLARAARGGENQALFDGLARHFSRQVASSPFETPDEQVELDDEALAAWRDTALARAPDATVRELWNDLARVLAGKRELERIERYVEPLAEKWRPSPELERALAFADLEMLDAAGAAQHFARAIAAEPRDVELRRMRARSLLAASDAKAAASELEAALELAPSDARVRRELAIARVRAGDPRGAAEIAALLRDRPDDAELRAHSGPGPYPAIEPRLR